MDDHNEKTMDSVHQIGLYDAHCHPTDIMSATERIAGMKAMGLTIMATRGQDQALVLETAKRYPVPDWDSMLNKENEDSFVVPSFGWHPWFAHQIYDDRDGKTEVHSRTHYQNVLTPRPDDDDFLNTLLTPRPLSEYLKQTEDRLLQFPQALVGEVGLDRSFRVPYGAFRSPDDPEAGPQDLTVKTGGPEEGQYTPGSREGRPLTPYRVSMEHQKMILKAQLELAAKHKRAVSVHSVATHGVIFDLLQSLWKGYEKLSKSAKKKQQKDAANAIDSDENKAADGDKTLPYPPRICMHSYSGPADALKQFLNPRVPAEIFFSFSELINFGSHNSEKAVEVIKQMPEARILIESDLHCAGEKMDQLLESILKRVCKIKGWELEEGAKILRSNWQRFVFG